MIATFKTMDTHPSTGPFCYLAQQLREGLFVSQFAITTTNTITTTTKGTASTVESSKKITKQLLKQNNVIGSWRKHQYHISQLITLVITSIEDYGIVLSDEDKSSECIMIARGIHVGDKKSYTIGQNVKAVILDFDMDKFVIEVSLSGRLVTGVSETLSKDSVPSKKKKQTNSTSTNNSEITKILMSLRTIGTQVKGRIELIRDKYMVVSVGNCVVCLVATADYHHPTLTPLELGYSLDTLLSDDKPLEVLTTVVKMSDETSHNMVLSEIMDIYQPTTILRIITDVQGILTTTAGEKYELNNNRTFGQDENSLKDGSSGGLEDLVTSRHKFNDSLRLGAVVAWRVVQVEAAKMTVVPYIKGQEYDESGHMVLNKSDNEMNVTGIVHLSGCVDLLSGDDNLEKSLASLQENVGDIISRSKVTEKHPFYGLKKGKRILARVVNMKRSAVGEKSAVCDQWTVHLSLEGLGDQPAMTNNADEVRVGICMFCVLESVCFNKRIVAS